MISLILPYWDRQEASDKAFEYLNKHYQGLDLEIVVIDDGNKVPFKVPETNLNVRVLRRPLKDEPRPPALAWNEGVEFAKGEIIVLSCIEILHETPVLEELVENLKKIGKSGYVLAAAWCPDELNWHCHSIKPVPTCPEGVGLSFCGAMYKELYHKAGGFDLDYMDGAGYEDRDFIWRLTNAGAQFIIRDDLVVTHPKLNAHIQWKPEGFKRNLAIYYSKWPHAKPYTFVCLKAGDMYSPEYVNTLHDMVLRNQNGMIGRFVCITDDPSGLDPFIEVLPLPDNLEKWYGKLYMFKRGLFPEGEKLVFMDLDTVITGRLDEILQYDGLFATLRDFYQPTRLGPAIILWKAGSFAYSIWDEWEQQGKPRNDLGDLWWLNNLDQGRFAHEVDKLQDLFPGKFVSYKKDCQVAPPNTAAVVCFHGLPRPHQVEGWVKLFWKKEGLSAADFKIVCNTELSKVVENIRYSSSLELPWLELKPETERRIVICGGGPSLVDSLRDIERERIKGSLIVALNGSGTFLKENGIYPDWLVMIDSRKSNVKFVKDNPAQKYFIASQCDQAIFDELKDKPVTLFHIDIPNIGEYVTNNGKSIQAIGGGSTVGLMAMCIAYTQGYRDIHLYGFDSSFDNEAHAYRQEQNDEVIEAIVAGKSFKTTPWMVTQTTQWQDLTNQLRQLGCAVTVHGDGLLPYLAWIKSIEETLTT